MGLGAEVDYWPFLLVLVPALAFVAYDFLSFHYWFILFGGAMIELFMGFPQQVQFFRFNYMPSLR